MLLLFFTFTSSGVAIAIPGDLVDKLVTRATVSDELVTRATVSDELVTRAIVTDELAD